MVPVPHRVTARSLELADTVTLALEPLGAGLPTPRPGQFNMLWAFGVGEVPISVSRIEGAGPIWHTVRSVGATTQALCALDEGDAVGVRGPFGQGWDVQAAAGRDVVVVGGGLGLAPLRPVIDEIVARREAFGKVAILMGARSPDDVLFHDALAAWGDDPSLGLDVAVTVDHARGDWHGHVGVVTELIPRLTVDRGSTTAFVCGPEIMMRFASRALRDAGVPAAHVQVSLERNMACAVAHCGHCQLGPTFLCREGPVYPLDVVSPLLDVKAL